MNSVTKFIRTHVIIIIILFAAFVWLVISMTSSNKSENFGKYSPPLQDYIGQGFEPDMCNVQYSPNQYNYNYNTQTDCGLDNGVFEDWINNGGTCPSGYHSDRNCGTGCRQDWLKRCA